MNQFIGGRLTISRIDPAREGDNPLPNLHTIETLHDNFMHDFDDGFHQQRNILQYQNIEVFNKNGVELSLVTNIHLMFHFVNVYIPAKAKLDSDLASWILLSFLKWSEFIHYAAGLSTTNPTEVKIGNFDFQHGSTVNRIFVYHEAELSKEFLDLLITIKKMIFKFAVTSSGSIQSDQTINLPELGFVLRGQEYHLTMKKNLNQQSDMKCFISYDYKNKNIAEFLYQRLKAYGSKLWFDSQQILPGDSIREQIEKGVRESSKCIVIISNDFIKNSGWAGLEFESFYIKEIIKSQRTFIPVWCNLDRDQVFEYSPKMAGISALVLPFDDYDSTHEDHKNHLEHAAIQIYKSLHGISPITPTTIFDIKPI